jgi:haloacetate dehalogenase
MEALRRCDAKFARKWWHWFFYGQPDKPEQAILANPGAWHGGSREEMGDGNYADFRAAIEDRATVIGMLGD